MIIPKIGEILEQKDVQKSQTQLEKSVVNVDTEYIELSNDAISNNKDVMVILGVLIMIAPTLSMALSLLNLDIDSQIMRIMMTMLIGQIFVNAIIVYVMSVQIKTAIKRTTRSMFLHFSNKDSIDKLKKVQSELDALRKASNE